MERQVGQTCRAAALVFDQHDVTDPIVTDALIIGAGPVGIFQAFQLGLLEIRTHIIDALPYAGGQCVELYPDKPIYDIPGLPQATGRQLVDNLLQQVSPFAPVFHFNQLVASLEKQPDDHFLVTTSSGLSFKSKTVFLAAGVGAFQPKRLTVPGLDAFENRGLFYQADCPMLLAGKRVVVVGGEQAAIESACAFAEKSVGAATDVTLLHRRETLTASPETLTRFNKLCERGVLFFKVGQVTGFSEADGQLIAADVTDVNGNTSPLPLDAMLVLQGLSPKLGPIASWGLDMARKKVAVDTEKFSSNLPGLFAVGDINTYPGKKKLILSGFHEAALAAFAAAALIFPTREILLQYTSASPKLHRLLGVEIAEGPAGKIGMKESDF